MSQGNSEKKEGNVDTKLSASRTLMASQCVLGDKKKKKKNYMKILNQVAKVNLKHCGFCNNMEIQAR